METGQDARPKRKRDLLHSASDDRPSKRASPDVNYQTSTAAATTTKTNGKMPRRPDTTQAQAYDSENDDMDSQAGSELSDVGPLVSAVAGADSAEWQATIEAVVKNVVSIHFCQTCAFDTDGACSSEATGFVVDAERGYILTNRHVVGAGPFSGFCIFDNYEEVDVHPVYRDPVHDFGILRFDPKAVKYMPLKSLELRPDLAKVGVEIRVVGNDAGEKLSILSGVISRMDRNAPEYGEGYSDFNTNYIQAAAAASGGSSGSPVVNLDGYAVALQAGGRADGAATDYFLPLDRPLRALKCIQEGKPISRGTIQTQWLMKAYDECRRLGLSSEWESELRSRFPKVNSLLVAEIVLPEGPASSHIQPGDVLIKVNGELLTQLIRLDDILDSHVGKSVRILVQRGGEDIEFEVNVGDLHAITPDRFVSVSGASFHDLSYQQARLHAVAVKGLFVCEAGGSYRFDGADAGWIIESVDRKPTPNLKAFIDVVQGIPDRARVVVTYKHLRDLHTLNTVIILVDRHWSSMMRMAVRNDETGLWDFTDLAEPLPAVKPAPLQADFPSLESSPFSAASDIIKSIVRISCVIPLKLDGFPRARRIGHGLVIDAEKGLVLVSRATVPYDLCDISITVADSIIIDAKVIFLHPLANYAILQYDPSIVLAPVKTAKLSTTPMKQGQSTTFIGFNQNLRVVIAKTTVTDITTVAIPQNGSAPRYRALNLDAITVDTGLSGQCGSGVLVKDDGTVDALWMTYLGERSSSSNKDVEYHLGLDAHNLLSVVEQIRNGQIPELRILPMEASTIHMSQARIMGVPDEVITQVTKANPARHQLFMVRKVDSPVPRPAKAGALSGAGSEESKAHKQQLMEGDIILTLNGKLITRVSELDIMYNEEKLSAVIVRKGQQLSLTIPTIPTRDVNTTHAVIFCGAVIHKPHHAVRQQISKIHSGVYISGRARGSPASMYGLAPTNFITAVNSVPTPTLEEFITETRKIPDNTYFRLRVVTFDNVEWVATMKKNEHYFPAMEYIRNDDGTWEKRKIESVVVAGSDEANDTTGVGEPPVHAVDDLGVDVDMPGEGFDN